MKHFPIQVGSAVYNDINALKQVQLGFTSRGSVITLYTLFSKWKKSDISISFTVFVESYCRDNHLLNPIEANNVNPPRVQTFAEAFNELANAPAFSPAEPRTRLQEAINTVLQQSIDGNVRASALVGSWAGSSTKIDVSGSMDFSADIDIEII